MESRIQNLLKGIKNSVKRIENQVRGLLSTMILMSNNPAKKKNRSNLHSTLRELKEKTNLKVCGTTDT